MLVIPSILDQSPTETATYIELYIIPVNIISPLYVAPVAEFIGKQLCCNHMWCLGIYNTCVTELLLDIHSTEGMTQSMSMA